MSVNSCCLDHVCVAANKYANNLSWGKNGLVIYGASRFIAIADPVRIKLLGTIPGHLKKVNAALWLPNGRPDQAHSPEFEFASASTDRSIFIWSIPSLRQNGTLSFPIRAERSACLSGHEAAVTGIACVLDAADRMWLASTSADGKVRIWGRPGNQVEEKWTLVQVLDFRCNLIEALAMTLAPDMREVILACGGSRNTVHVFSSNGSETEKSIEKIEWKEVACLSGHENWIRSLAFSTVKQEEGQKCLLLASAGQDKRVRVWKFEREEGLDGSSLLSNGGGQRKSSSQDRAAVVPREEGVDLSNSVQEKTLTECEWRSDDEVVRREEGQIEESLTRWGLGSKDEVAPSSGWKFKLESIILGHDEWILGVCWSLAEAAPELLTVGMDKMMALWSVDMRAGLWVESARVGEVGGSQLGFFAGTRSPDGKYMLAFGYTGSWYLWKEEVDEERGRIWNSMATISGHFGEVREVSWDASYSYLASVSGDQTTRLWAKWTRTKPDCDGGARGAENSGPSNTWHEMGRIQVHGHNICGCAFVPGEKVRIVSCSEEKVLRILEMPRATHKMLNALADVPLPSESIWEELSVTASVPALGLSNKPVNGKKVEQEKHRNDGKSPKCGKATVKGDGALDVDSDPAVEYEEALALTQHPPREEQLAQRTLWPEIAKLYGHGNELATVTSSRRGDVVASACSCKVQTQEQAGIRLWRTSDWKQLSVLKGPALTVTQLEFSHDDQYLLAVSRDRGVYLYCRDEEQQYALSWHDRKTAHQKIVWSGSWSIDDNYIATGSRDKTMKIWKLNRTTNVLEQAGLFKMAHSVTSVAWLPYLDATLGHVIATGSETGEIVLWACDVSKDSCNAQIKQLVQISSQDSHVDHITRIAWAPKMNRTFEMATSSLDGSVRIFRVFISQTDHLPSP